MVVFLISHKSTLVYAVERHKIGVKGQLPKGGNQTPVKVTSKVRRAV